jgi:tellurite resistance protein TerC
VDSIPAIFAVTDDPFIVFTSNIFAILGLRALYFVLSGYLSGLAYLKPALAAILIFVGTKMVLADVYKIDPLVSLAVIGVILGGAIVGSLLVQREGGGVPLRPGSAPAEEGTS